MRRIRKFHSDLGFLETYWHSVRNTSIYYVGPKYTDCFVGSSAEVWDQDVNSTHVWRCRRSMQFRVPLLYPQCNTHSTNTALPV